ncbi:MAG TPA: DUF2141 domain-containing protein [Caulobacteraceae bacterium]|nr:DUF2141 domain-containing protein [Caulobacteraceae bacterium]
MTSSILRSAAGALALAASLAAGAAQADPDCHGKPSPHRLFVVIENIRNNTGLMVSSLYTDDGRFLKKGGSLSVWRTPAHPPTQTMCVYLPKVGNFAVGVYQDVNSNMKIDHNLLGPTEPWGFTNNPHALFALPTFGQVKFASRPGDNYVHVRLNHP